MDNFEIALGGLRALLFSTAFFSAAVFLGEVDAGWGLICAVMKGRVRSSHLVGLAAFGWFITALSRLLLSFPRMLVLLFEHKVYGTQAHGFWDALWMLCGMTLLVLGFYIPVLAIKLYRRRGLDAALMGIASLAIGVYFAYLTALYLPPYYI